MKLAEPEIFTFGGRIALMDFGLPEKAASFAVLPALVVLILLAMTRRWTTGVATQPNLAAETHDARASAVLASVLLLACFVSGINHGYRWIFALWLAPWFWATRDRNVASRVSVWLLPIILWHDGLLCLATTFWFPHLQQEQYDRILVAWRWVTEPLTWMLMILLGAGLVELAFKRASDIRFAFAAKKSGESSAT